MWPRIPTSLILIVVLCVPAVPGVATQLAECGDWQECRAQSESAIANEAFERAHDLAWRAVQRGPKDDPALMFLLARAQSLSGRPHDALVMVRRLAERGVVTAAATHADLARTRALPGWAEVQELVGREGRALPPAPARAVPPPVPAMPAATPSLMAGVVASAPPARVVSDAVGLVEETVRFSRDRFATGGLAYDAVSHRFVVGDRDGRKLRVVGKGLDEAVDLVRAESAGFASIRALAIDSRRGDLWVASADEDTGTATLHRLQLVSGRPLEAYPLASVDFPSAPLDLAITAAGAVLLLDSRGRLARLRPGAASVDAPIDLGVSGATSVAAGGVETRAFVAYGDGILHVSLPGGKATALSAPDAVRLDGFLRLRSHRDGLVGLQADGEGTAHLVRLALQPNGRRVRTATAFDTRIATGDGAIAFAVSGDEVALVGDVPAADRRQGPDTLVPPLVVRRVRLQ